MPRATSPGNSPKKPYDKPSKHKVKRESTSDSEDEDVKVCHDRQLFPTPLHQAAIRADTKPDVKPKKKSTKAPGRTWTGPELVTLFEIAAAGVKRTDYVDKLDGRTDMQCLKTWQVGGSDLFHELPGAIC